MNEIICLTVGDFAVNSYFFAYKNKLCCVDPGAEGENLVHEIHKLTKEYNLLFDSIFLTHGHLDHVGALPFLKSTFPNVKIYANRKEKNHLGQGSRQFQYDDFSVSGMGGYVKKVLGDKTDLPDADIYFSDGQILFDEWKVLETPGHTKGSSCLYNEKQKILFCGDTLFFNGFGRTDLFGGDDKQMRESLKIISKLPEDILVYPGHGYYGFALSQTYTFGL
ncbi:MAG: MBL fold metallo-hydrolase [Treponemataceae bacterium]